MPDTLLISLDDLQQAHLKELFPLLDQAFTALNISYYVLGALARGAWYATANKQARATRDIDLAIYVDSNEHYEELMATLVADYEFGTIKDAPFKLRTPFGYTMDFIPFGIESIDEKFELEEGWDEPIYINGLEEVFESATVKAMDKEAGIEFNIASLPAILLLKLIAYDDRPEKRNQDPGDIREIILNYFDLQDHFIWDKHNDLFTEDNMDLELHEYSAIVIGRQMKDILAQNERLRDRILTILSLENRTQQRMVEAMTNNEITEEQVKRWLTLIAQGIQD